MTKRLFGICLFLTHATTALPAPAERESPAKKDGIPPNAPKSGARGKGTATQNAEALFRRGRVAFERRDYDKACEAFAASLSWEAAPGAALNLAACEESRNHLLRAFQNWQLALELLDPADRRYTYASKQAEDLKPRIPRLRITQAGHTPDGVVVKIEGAPVRLGAPLAVEPGNHDVIVSARGHEDRRYQIYIAAGQERTLKVEPGALLPKHDDRRRLQTGLGGAVLGLGVASVAAAATTGILLEQQRKKFEAHCDPECDDDGHAAAKRGRNLLRANTATWIAGAIGVVGGSVLLFTRPKERGIRDASLSLSPAKATLQIRGTF